MAGVEEAREQKAEDTLNVLTRERRKSGVFGAFSLSPSKSSTFYCPSVRTVTIVQSEDSTPASPTETPEALAKREWARKILEKNPNVFESFAFDSIAFAKDNPHSLLEMSMMALESLNIFGNTAFCPVKAAEFFEKVESSYNSETSYHNSTHATDVVQSTVFLMKDFPELTFHQKALLVIAAAAHDVDHTGRTNWFLGETEHEYFKECKKADAGKAEGEMKLAPSYQEFHHSQTTEKLIKETELCKHLLAEGEEFIESVKSMIICTDMQRQDGVIKEVKTRATKSSETQSLVLLSVILHSADISNPGRPFEIAQQWFPIVNEELSAEEKDCQKIGKRAQILSSKSKSQENSDQFEYAKTYVLQWYRTICEQFPDKVKHFKEIVKAVEDNCKKWKEGITVEESVESQKEESDG